MAGTLDIGTLSGRIELADNFTPVLNRAVTQLGAAGTKFTTLGGSIQRAGTSLLPVSAIVGAIGVSAIKMATDFNAGMANVATLIPGNIERIKQLKTTVQGMAIEVGKSTGDLTNGLYQVISALGDTADTEKILEINAKAAAAGLATTNDAINLTTAVTKGYGDTSAEAFQKVSDLSFVTVKLGQTTFPELAQSIGQVVPVAAALKVSQEELFAGFATLTGVTGHADEVTTQLRQAMVAFLKPTDQMTESIRALGYQSAEALLSDKGFVGAMRAVIGTTDGSTEAVGKLFNNIRALPAVFALTGGQADTFNTKLAEMQKTAGATDEAFKEQTQGINAAGFAWQQFKAEVEETAQNLGDALLPSVITGGHYLKGLFEIVKGGVGYFVSLDQSTKNVAAGIGGMVIIAAPALIGLGLAFKAVGTAASGMGLAIGGSIKVVKYLGDTVPVLTARIWLLEISEKAAATAAGAFVIAAGPVILTLTAVSAALAIGYQAWKLWSENSERAAQDARQASVDQSNLAIINEKTGKSFKDIGEATAYVLKQNQERMAQAQASQDVDEKTKAALAAVAAATEDVGEKTEQAKAQTKEMREAMEELASAGDGWKGTLAKIDEETVKNVKHYLEAGVAQETLAKVYNLTTTQVTAITKAFNEEQKAMENEARAIQETTKLWSEYNSLRAERAGSVIDAEVAKINEWAASVKAAAIRAHADTKEFYDALEALTKEKLDGVMINWDQLAGHTRQSLQDTADKAQATYEYVYMHAEQFSRDFIQLKRDEARAAQDAVRDFGKGFDDEMQNVSDSAAKAGENFKESFGGAVDEIAGKVRTLSGEVMSLKEFTAKQNAGGSFQITRANLASNLKFWHVPEEVGFAAAQRGFSFQEIVQAYQAGMIAEWKPAGPRIPGFKLGGMADFGSGSLAVLHGREMIVPVTKLEDFAQATVAAVANSNRVMEPILKASGTATAAGPVNNIFYVNGTGREVANVVKLEIMRSLKQVRKFGAA